MVHPKTLERSYIIYMVPRYRIRIVVFIMVTNPKGRVLIGPNHTARWTISIMKLFSNQEVNLHKAVSSFNVFLNILCKIIPLWLVYPKRCPGKPIRCLEIVIFCELFFIKMLNPLTPGIHKKALYLKKPAAESSMFFKYIWPCNGQ